MEKSFAIAEKVVTDSASRVQGERDAAEGRKDHLKIWREIYRDVRRQWAEAESGRTGRYRYQS